MLEKKRPVFSKRCSAHRILWICSGLSTAGRAFDVFLPETGATGLPQPVFGSRTASSLVHRRRAGTQAAFQPRVPHAVPAKPSNVRAFAAHVFSRTLRADFFLNVQTWILVCSRHVRISFFCQTGFFEWSIRPGLSLARQNIEPVFTRRVRHLFN
jgi:hypothetical protein